MVRMTAPPGLELLKRLKTMTGQTQSQGYDTLAIISVGMLPTAGDSDPFWAEFDQLLWDYKARFKAALYELSMTDRAVLVRDKNIGKGPEKLPLTDLRVRLLRLIKSHFPNSFQTIVQARLVGEVNLKTDFVDAMSFVEGLESRPGRTGEKSEVKGRQLTIDDIDKVAKVSRELGLSEFSKAFIRSQKTLRIKTGTPPEHFMDEYFVTIDALKSYVFKGVDMRGSGALFDQLTLTLDNVLLNGFRTIKSNGADETEILASLNLNVESVFSESFNQFVEGGGDQGLQGLVFEFRQSDMMANFDAFYVACDWIRNEGGKIAVDAIFAETMGVVNFSHLDVDYAKIFWRKGAGDVLKKFTQEIALAQGKGIEFIFARVDDASAIQFGQKIGVDLFQGFYVDDL